MEVRLSEILSALSFALDVTEGQPAGHLALESWVDAGQRSPGITSPVS